MESTERRQLLARARTAYRAHRYAEAYSALSAARAHGALGVEDLRILADAAWWTGLVRECLAITEEIHRRLRQAGDVEQAAAHALDLAGMLAMRGEHALAAGWLSRARRLLAGRPAGRAQGMLAYVSFSEALGQGRLEVAEGEARTLHALRDRLGRLAGSLRPWTRPGAVGLR